MKTEMQRHRVPKEDCMLAARCLFPGDDPPEVCPICSHRINRNDASSIARHRRPGPHLPHAGQRVVFR